MSGPEDASVTGWRRLDKAAFGINYGAVMVLSILLAQGSHPAPPLESAVVLFGSVLAITLAKAFAEFLGHALEAKERMTRHSWRAAWNHGTPTLAVANAERPKRGEGRSSRNPSYPESQGEAAGAPRRPIQRP